MLLFVIKSPFDNYATIMIQLRAAEVSKQVFACAVVFSSANFFTSLLRVISLSKSIAAIGMPQSDFAKDADFHSSTLGLVPEGRVNIDTPIVTSDILLRL